MTTASPSLLTLLEAHPFADDDGLMYTASTSVSVAETRAAVGDLADELAAIDVGDGRPVAVQLPNGPAIVIAMFAIWRAGGVFVPLNPRAPQAEIDQILDETDAAAVVDAEGLRARSDSATRHDADVAFVLWTSGTTGRPKAVLHTHTAYFELLDRVLAPLRGTADPDREPRRPSPNLIPVSMALNAGIYNVLFGLRAGAALVIMDRFDTSSFAALVQRFEIRSTVLPPAALTMLSEDEAVTDLTPLRYVRSITAPLSPMEARRFFDKFGVFVLNGYGQAEIGEVIGWTAAHAREHPERIGAVGRPHPGVEIRIGDSGELLVRPPNMAAGYADGRELSDRIDADGFVRTGDLAHVDEAGFVWIDGRMGDVINRGGNKVFPEAVEDVLRTAVGVDDVAVVGVPDDRLGAVPVAAVVGHGVDEAALDRHCREQLVAYKVPVRFVAVDEIARTEIGKIRRAEVAAEVAGLL